MTSMGGAIWGEQQGWRLGVGSVVAALPAPGRNERHRDDREFAVTHHLVQGEEGDVDLFEVGNPNLGAVAVYARAKDAAAHFRAVTEGFGYPREIVSAALFGLMWGRHGNEPELHDLIGYVKNERGDE